MVTKKQCITAFLYFLVSFWVNFVYSKMDRKGGYLCFK